MKKLEIFIKRLLILLINVMKRKKFKFKWLLLIIFMIKRNISKKSLEERWDNEKGIGLIKRLIMSDWEIGVYDRNGIPTINFGSYNEVSISMEYDHLEQRYYYFDAKCFEYITPDDKPEDFIPIIEGIAFITNGAIVLVTKNVQKL